MASVATVLWQYIQGAIGLYTDWNSDNDNIRNKVGQSVEQILGAASALPSSNASGLIPLACIPGSGLQVLVGGTNQGVYLQDRVCDSCPQIALTVPTNSLGSTRYDMVAIQYAQTQVNGATRNIKNPGTGNITTATVYQLEDSFTAEYVTGTTGGLPAVPAGWVAFAQVAVPNGAGTITGGEITILLPSVASLLAGLLNSYFTGAGLHGITTVGVGGFIIPAPTGSGGGSVSVPVVDGTGFIQPMRALIYDGTNLVLMKISAETLTTLTATTEQILAGTIGNTMAAGAVVTYAGVTEYLPVGSTQRVWQRLPAVATGTQTLTLQLPSQGVWQVYAKAEGFLNANAVMTVALSGITSFESGVGLNSIKVPSQGGGGFAKADCNGSSQGGQLVTAQVSFTQANWTQNGSSVPMAGTFELLAYRVS